MSIEQEAVPTEVQVIRQGYIIVNSARVVARGENVAAIEVDLHSKYGEVATWGNLDGIPFVMLDGNNSIRGNELVPKTDFTEIAFPEFLGFDVHSVYFGKYNVSVCLVRE